MSERVQCPQTVKRGQHDELAIFQGYGDKITSEDEQVLKAVVPRNRFCQ